MGNFIRSVLSAASAILQSKTVTPTTSQQTVGPDSGYDGLSQVIVDPIPSEYVIPSGTKALGTFTTNGWWSRNCSGYESVSFYTSVSATLSETTLYTNTSGNSWSEKTVTLSEGISNYDYIKIYFMNSTSYTDNVMSVIIPVSDLGSMNGANFRPYIAIGGTQTSSAHYVRMVKYVSNTQLTFSNVYKLEGGTGSGNYAIPTKICGLV